MLKGIKINKFINKILSENEELLELVGRDNIKAMILNPTNYPFVSYKRNSIETLYNKDIPYLDKVQSDIICVSDNYAQSIEIAQKVREILEYQVYKNSEENVLIDYMIMIDSDEDTISDVYVQTLKFEFHVKDIN